MHYNFQYLFVYGGFEVFPYEFSKRHKTEQAIQKSASNSRQKSIKSFCVTRKKFAKTKGLRVCKSQKYQGDVRKKNSGKYFSFFLKLMKYLRKLNLSFYMTYHFSRRNAHSNQSLFLKILYRKHIRQFYIQNQSRLHVLNILKTILNL